MPTQPSVNARSDKTIVLGMRLGAGVQRKVFRIEQMFAGSPGAAVQRHSEQSHPIRNPATDEFKAVRRLAEQHDGHAADAVQLLKQELALIHETIARNKRDLVALIGDGKERKMARAAGELGAAVEGMEKATVTILKSVEVVDDSAKALTVSLKDEYKRGLAQDIQDHVVKIYEACNFQDLAGQRIGSVVRTLNLIEEQVAAMLDRCDAVAAKGSAPAQSTQTMPAPGNDLLNGPRLDGDGGHASQGDIDMMFD